MNQNQIRNFCIIAHIDHGKSTLADRLLELTNTVPKRQMRDQILDQMDLERERGITIKAQAVRMSYKAKDGKDYILNLIDTPGHVDFSYEVSRSLAACEGALLVVDAVQGVEAQTVANASLAIENGLTVIPVINKIDLANAAPQQVSKEIKELIGKQKSEPLLASAKTGKGATEVLEAIVNQIPAPSGKSESYLRALIFDSVYDSYRGVIVFIRVVDGRISKGDKVKFMASGQISEVEELGFFSPSMVKADSLAAGEVGYVIAGIKDMANVKVGDTLVNALNPAKQALSGYQEPKPMVFAGLYTLDGGEYPELREALAKLKLNDPSLSYAPETSPALGFGFRCGFLGLLHMEIVKERLEREYDLELVATAPNVAYRVKKKDGSQQEICNPSEFPPANQIESIKEPYIKASILAPPEYLGAIVDLCQQHRGQLIEVQYLSEKRVQINYHLPLSEIVIDFYDQLKSKTRGYATLDYEFLDYQVADLVKLEILVAGKPIDAFSSIVPRNLAFEKGKTVLEKLRQAVPKQMFEIALQAAIGGRIIARETIRAKRKDVLSKCYGGDVTRKRKLLEKQKLGKKRMKKVGRVSIPQEAFLSVLKSGKTS